MNNLPLADKTLFAVCRFCERMAEQLAHGATRCLLACGGPTKGLAYPLYRGPLPRAWLAAHCVVCEAPAQKQVEVHGQGMVGACNQHLGLLVPEAATTLPPERWPALPKQPESLYDLLGIDPVNDLGFPKDDGSPSPKESA